MRLIFLFLSVQIAISGTKMYNSQRMFIDERIINFVDPSKHGFHVVLDEQFVNSHLQPVHLPTVYASAIALRQLRNETKDGSLRTTKILYPENGNPDNGLLDGRTIKLLGLRERTWYYVCVEFESNVNRHEIATGTACKLARTLDKFGKTVESTISQIQVLEITHDSIRIRMNVDTDFALKIHAYMNLNSDESDAAIDLPSSEIFLAKKSTTLNAVFGNLRSDTSYGRFCVLEEPLSDTYTAMGRNAKAIFEHCYFENLKTKPAIGHRLYEHGVFVVEESLKKGTSQREVAKLISNGASVKSIDYSLINVFVISITFSLM